MLYDKVKEKIITEYIKDNPLDDETSKQEISKKYFEEWANSLLSTAEIKYISSQE